MLGHSSKGPGMLWRREGGRLMAPPALLLPCTQKSASYRRGHQRISPATSSEGAVWRLARFAFFLCFWSKLLGREALRRSIILADSETSTRPPSLLTQCFPGGAASPGRAALSSPPHPRTGSLPPPTSLSCESEGLGETERPCSAFSLDNQYLSPLWG